MVAQLHILPTLPVVRDRLRRTMENPQSSIKDVGAIVGADPVLTARLLQAVDWRRTIFANKVPGVGKAISVLGFEALRQLVQTQEILDVPQTDALKGGTFPIKNLWLHSVATAIAAQTIATHSSYPDPDECFIAGLLHDIGKLVLQQLFPDRFYGLIAEAQRAQTTLYQCEVESRRASHAVLGRLLAEAWGLPPKIVEAIGWHHTPQLAELHPKIVAVTHMADILARALGWGSGGDPYVPPLKPAALNALNLRTAQVEQVMTAIEAEYPRAAASLR